MFRNNKFEGTGSGPIGMLYTQKTLADTVACTGVGLHSGARISMILKPAVENSGIKFIRTDIFGKNNVIPALYSNVADTRLSTCLANEDGVGIATIEHLMAAFHATGITNVVVEVSGAELPILDGSAAPFLFLIECAGIKEQNAPLKAIRILKEVGVSRAASGTHSDASAQLSPAASGLEFDFLLDYPNDLMRNQRAVCQLDLKSFKSSISQARTFCFLHEIEYMQKNGLARGGSLKNAVVVDNDKVMNEEGLRYDDEFARHKMVDAIGDLYTSGHTIIGKYSAVKAGHQMNNELLKQLFSDASNYEIVDMNEVFMGKNYRFAKVFCE